MFTPFEIAERIKLCAKEHGITVKSALKEAGVGEKMVSNMGGKKGSYPQSDKLAQIADYFNCSVDYLLGRTDSPNETVISVTDNKQTSLTGNNSISINSDVHHKKDTLTEQFIKKFEQLDFDDKVDVMQYVKNKK